MDFDLPGYLAELDAFIEREIRPLERQDDNIRFFDHRREHARTDWENGGLPREESEALLGEARRRAGAAGHLRITEGAEEIQMRKIGGWLFGYAGPHRHSEGR